MIKFIPVTRIYDEVHEVLASRMETVFASNNHFEGQFMERCQEMLRSYTGRKHAFITQSGTSSITIMLLAAGIQPGDRVATINYSCPATVMPIKLLGAVPVYNDIDKHGQMTLDNVAGVKAILTTGLYGDCYDHDKIKDLGVPILNDSAQSFQAKYKGIESTKLGDMSILSFSTNKNCPVFGTYGAVMTDDDSHADAVFLMRRNGYKSRDVGHGIQYIGMNAQPTEDKCAQLLTSLEKLPEWQQRRLQISGELDRGMDKLDVCVRTSPEYSTRNNHKFCIFAKDKWKLRDAMKDLGVDCHLHYTYNFADTEVLQGERQEEYPGTEFYRKHAISLPSNPWLKSEEIKYIIQSVEKCYTEEDRELCQKM